MPNPFAPRPRVRRPVRVVPDHPPVARLQRLGASKEQLAEVYRRWSELTDDERIESTADLNALSDEEIRQGLAEMAAAGLDPGPAGPEPSAAPPDGAQQPEGAAEAPGGAPALSASVREVMGWVGTDKARAQLVLDTELAKPEGARRSTLLRRLRRVLGG